MRNILRGTNFDKSCQISHDGNTKGTEGKENGENKLKKNASSPKSEFMERFGRKLKITFLDPEDKESLSSLLISEEYSIVFCFPVSSRFTNKDLDLLETYLKYRQREDHSRITIAFTYSERLDCEEKVYINNLPEIFKDYLQKFRNKYVFMYSSGNQHENNVKTLTNSGNSDEFTRVFYKTLFIFVAALIVL